MKTQAAKTGLDIIRFGLGDPDPPPPSHIVEVLNEAAENPANHQYTSIEFSAHVLRETGVVMTPPPLPPGNGFGEAGEGFVRMALTQSEDRIEEALERIGKVGF